MILEMVALSVVQVKKQQTYTCKFIAILKTRTGTTGSFQSLLKY